METIKLEKESNNRDAIENHDDGVTRYYKITARNEGQLNMLEKVFAYIESLGTIGSSRQLTIFCDGDGVVQLKFQKHHENEFVFQDLDHEKVMNADNGYGHYTINDSDGEGKDTYFDLG
jgi:hypothetical protein